MIKNVIKHTTNLDVGSNEYATKYSVNRILNRLLENDVLLENFYKEVFGQFMIYEYVAGETYYYNDLIWFLDSEKDLHILRCIKNQTSVDLTKWKKTEAFADYGWKDLNPDIDILKEFGLEKRISSWIAKKIKEHQDDESVHPLGKISYGWTKPTTDINTKIANREMSNLNPYREQTFFPYWTTYLKTSSTSPIVGGYCRKYDNGLLEYDLIFRLSYCGITEVDEDYGLSANILSCNMLDLANSHVDSKYFNTINDASIFNQGGMVSSNYESEIGDTRQRCRNDFVNVYAAQLDFAAAANTNDTILPEFSSDSYMIFSSSITCQSRDITTNAINIGANSIVFCKKQTGSVTALLVTYPNQKFSTAGYNAINGGIQANSFHCQLIGKWK